MTGLVERKVHPGLILVVIGKGALVGIVRRCQMTIAVACLNLQGDLTPAVNHGGSTFFAVSGNLTGKRPHHRIRTVARHQVAGEVFLVFHGMLAVNGMCPRLPKCIH